MGEGDEREERAILTALGVRVVLKKPFNEAELLAALSSELGGTA